MSSLNSSQIVNEDYHKQEYGINYVSEKLGLHPRTLMYYERKGLVSPARSPQNQRRYSEYDMKRIKFIHFMASEGKFPLFTLQIIFDAVRQLNQYHITPRMPELQFIAHHLKEEPERTS